jgi:hypothetical protein
LLIYRNGYTILAVASPDQTARAEVQRDSSQPDFSGFAGFFREVIHSKRSIALSIFGEIYLAALINFGIFLLLVSGKIVAGMSEEAASVIKIIERWEKWVFAGVSINYLVHFASKAFRSSWWPEHSP